MSTRRALLEGILASTAWAMLPATSWAAAAPRPPLSRGYDPSLFHRAMTADPGPIDLTIGSPNIRGAIPDVLRGWTYLSNGPSRLDWDGQTVHPFDGHGYLRAFHFDAEGQVRFRARYIQTPAFQAEDTSQTLVYRGLGTLAASPGERGWRRTNRKAPGRRNVANTTIYPWGDALLAGWEGGLPYAVDPHTLDTQGPFHFEGALSENEAFLAHVRLDHSRNRLVGVSPRMGPKTTLTFREFDDQNSLVSKREVTLPWPVMIHDFVITENYYGLVSNTLKLKMGTLLRTIGGADSLINAIDFNREEEGELVLIPRTEGPIRRIPLGKPAFVIHYA
ncbi:MAG: carotenoid oxygenase family protein, partial [Myxococcota bacterium]|nr:carotenoid oxygenase family protein [Myxococcota bacterium]